MATWNSPAVARRWLAHELRTRREALGLSQSAVGKACGWSGVKVSYIENAQQNVTEDDLDKLLAEYQVRESEGELYLEAVQIAREKGWWERYSEDVVPAHLSAFIGLEQGASLIRTFEPIIVPGLLQTPAYAEATIAAELTRRTPRVVRRIQEVRLARQSVLSREAEPAEFVAVVDESVLRRVVGGPVVMAEQLEFILTLVERPNIRLHIFPFERGIRTGLVGGAYRILHFERSEPPVVYMETHDGAQWLDQSTAVDLHDLAFEELLSSSLTEGETREMIVAAAEWYARRR